MKSVEINVKTRTEMTKNELGRFRGQGNIPAVLYGKHMEKNLNLALEVKEFAKLLSKHGRSSILIFKSDDTKLNGTSALIKEVQRDAVLDTFLNVDLVEIRKGEKITISIPIEFIGEPKGAKEGGVVDIQRRELKVECLPTDIPDKVTIDISKMGLNDVLHVSDVQIAGGVKIIDDKSFALISVRIVKEKVEEAPVVAEVAAGAEGAAAVGADGKPVEGAAAAAGKTDAKADGAAKAAPAKEVKKDKK